MNLFHGLNFENAAVVGQYLMDAFRNGDYDRIDIVYNQFKNVATQILITEQFLPVLPIGRIVTFFLACCSLYCSCVRRTTVLKIFELKEPQSPRSELMTTSNIFSSLRDLLYQLSPFPP